MSNGSMTIKSLRKYLKKLENEGFSPDTPVRIEEKWHPSDMPHEVGATYILRRGDDGSDDIFVLCGAGRNEYAEYFDGLAREKAEEGLDAEIDNGP